MKLLFFLATAAMFGQQWQTPITVLPGPGSSSGAIRLREPASQPGQNWTAIQAPSALGSNQTFTWLDGYGTAGQCISGDGAGVLSWAWCQQGERVVSDYIWTQTVGALVTPGTITLTFSSGACPFAATDVFATVRVYESVVPTTDEIGVVNGGTCTRGGSGTLTVTGIGGTYTNAIATSASDGWQEAIFSVADGLPVRLRATERGYHIYSEILTLDRAVTAQCDSPFATLVPRDDNLKIFNVAAPSAMRIYNCGVSNPYAHTGVQAVYFNNPDGSTFGGRVQGMNIDGVENGVHAVTGYLLDVLDNRFLNNTHAAMWFENIDTGDAGLGRVEGNNSSCSVTCDHGVLWNSPGALQVKSNGFNGFTEQVTLDPHHGYASSANSGADTIITWQSGNRFRPQHVGHRIQVGPSQSCVVDTYTNSTEVICVGENIGTITNERYYVGTTGQVQIMENLFDGGANTTHGVRWLGGIFLINAQIEQNFVANYSVVGAKGISIEGSGVRILTIKNNNIQSAALSSTIGIDVTAGEQIHVEANQVYGHATGINVGSSALYVQTEANRCASNATTCIASATSTATIRETGPITYTELAALTAANSSSIFCTNCKSTVSGCATGGTGAEATRINGTWRCMDEASGFQPWLPTGSDIYVPGSTNVGIGIGPSARLTIGGGSGTNSMVITDSTIATILAVNVSAGLAQIGTNTNHGIQLFTNATGRFELTNAGHLVPVTHDAYDAGTTSMRLRTIYARAGEFYRSSGTSSSDYVSTRKYNFMDSVGGPVGWDITAEAATGAKALHLRDAVGDPALNVFREISGTPANEADWYTDLIPAKRAIADGHTVTDTNYPSLGRSSAPWHKLWATDGDFAGDVTIDGTTVAATINYSGGTMAGNMTPLFSGTGKIGTSSLPYGEGHFTDLTITGTCTGCGGVPVVDTTPIVKGSADATKLLRLEVDGLTTATTRVGTWPDANITVAGTNYPQTFTEKQKFTYPSNDQVTLFNNATPSGSYEPSCLAMSSTNTSSSSEVVAGRFCGGYNSASFAAEELRIQTATGSGTYQTAISWTNLDTHVYGALTVDSGVSVTGNISGTGNMSIAGQYNGNTADILGNVDADSFSINGTTVINSSRNLVSIAGLSTSLVPTATNSYAIGGVGSILSAVYTGQLYASTLATFTGATITAPSGSTGLNTTKTVRDAAGTGTCTLIISGGLITGGTC